MERALYTNFRWWETGETQAMLVEGGKVAGRASRVAADAHPVDLQGRTLFPSFIDSHCHIIPTGLDLQKLNLDAANTHDEVLSMVADWHAANPSGWLHAVHYDQTKYEIGHLTRRQLDRISSTRPILLRHVSGHASVANSAALQAAGVDENTADPPGGSFGRDCADRLDGVLFEAAHEFVTAAAPAPTVAEMTEAILLAGERMADFGIACASDMATGRYGLEAELQAYTDAAKRGCKIKTRLYVQWRSVFGGRAMPIGDIRDQFEALSKETDGASKVAGIKIFSDGAIGSATAAIYGRYSGAPATGPTLANPRSRPSHPDREVSGQLMYDPAKLTHMVRIADEAGFQVSVHAIGDFAADLVMDAFEATGNAPRHRMEHGMILSDPQITRLASLGSFLTFQPEFLMRFGHSYRKQLGPERAATLKRTRSVLDAGIPLSFSSDRPIVGGNPLDGMRAAESRPQGFDPAENCTFAEAVRAYTVAGARVNGDGGTMGELLPGQDASFRLG